MKLVEFRARGAGQTTWCVFKAAQKVVEGKHVIVISENQDQAREMCQQIYRVLTTCIPKSCLSKTLTTIRNAPTKVCVTCISNERTTRDINFTRGIRNISLLVDLKHEQSDFTCELIEQMYIRKEEII